MLGRFDQGARRVFFFGCGGRKRARGRAHLLYSSFSSASGYVDLYFFCLFRSLPTSSFELGSEKAKVRGLVASDLPFRSSSFHSPFPPHHKHKQGGPRKRSASSLYVKDRSKPLELKKRVEMERRGWASKNDRSKRTRVMKRSPRKERSRYRAEKRESRKDKEMGITGN